MSSKAERGTAEGRPDQRRVLAVRDARLVGRGDSRLDPRRHRSAEPQDGRAGGLPRDPREVMAGQSQPGKGWGKSTPKSRPGGASTSTSSDRCSLRSSKASTSPRPIGRRRSGSARPSRPRRWRMLNGAFSEPASGRPGRPASAEAGEDAPETGRAGLRGWSRADRPTEPDLSEASR